jgi:predicted SAM-dependent methyltransferase
MGTPLVAPYGRGLNVGCGSAYWDGGYVNTDVIRQWPGYQPADVVCDARKPFPFADGSFGTVYLGHLLQHIAQPHHADCLAECWRVLTAPGILVATEVDMDIVMPRFLQNPMDIPARELIWGEQGVIHGEGLVEADTHRHGFTEDSLREVLTDAGFTPGKRVRLHHRDVFYELSLSAAKEAG